MSSKIKVQFESSVSQLLHYPRIDLLKEIVIALCFGRWIDRTRTRIKYCEFHKLVISTVNFTMHIWNGDVGSNTIVHGGPAATKSVSNAFTPN